LDRRLSASAGAWKELSSVFAVNHQLIKLAGQNNEVNSVMILEFQDVLLKVTLDLK